MVIIYEGNHIEKICRRVKGKEVAIFDRNVTPFPKKAIYYLEKGKDHSCIRSLPKGWAIEMEQFHSSFLLEYPERIFTKNFQMPRILGELYVSGRIEAISSLCAFLLKEYRYSIGLSGDDLRLSSLMEKSKGRAEAYKAQPLHLHLGFGPRNLPHLHLWDGSLEGLYRLREEYEELPRYHALVQWGGKDKHFYQQDLLQGRYLGRLSKKGFSFQWRRILRNF